MIFKRRQLGQGLSFMLGYVFLFFFPADAEKGCHFLHVLRCVRQSYNPNLAEVVIQRVLELLESNSDIVSTMDGYYMAF